MLARPPQSACVCVCDIPTLITTYHNEIIDLFIFYVGVLRKVSGRDANPTYVRLLLGYTRCIIIKLRPICGSLNTINTHVGDCGDCVVHQTPPRTQCLSYISMSRAEPLGWVADGGRRLDP